MSSLWGKGAGVWGAGSTADHFGQRCGGVCMSVCARAHMLGLKSKRDSSPSLHAHFNRDCPIYLQPFLTPIPVSPNNAWSGPGPSSWVGWGMHGKRRGSSSAGWCLGAVHNRPTTLFPSPLLHSRAALGPADPVAGLEVHGLSRRGAATIMTGNSLHLDHQQLGFLHPEAASRLLILELLGAVRPLGE